MVAPIRLRSGSSTEASIPRDINVETPVAKSDLSYCPLLISIKSRLNCGPQDAKNISKRALGQFKEAHCEKALFLVIIMGSATKSDYEDLSLKGREDIDLLVKGEFIARVLGFPRDLFL